MNSLVHTPLGEIAKFNPTFKAKAAHPNELVDFLPMSAVNAALTTVRAIEQRQLCEVQKGYTNFADGDVLLAKITPCFENGKIAFAQLNTEYGFGSTEFHVIRVDRERLDARYLVHFLRRDEVRVDGARNMTGSAGQRRVPKHYLESLSVPLPQLAAQRRIAAILDQADALRAKRREALAQLDSLTQSIFIEMFGDPATNPKSWPVKTIEQLCEVKGGKRLPKGSEYSASPTPFRYVRVTNIVSGRVDESNLLYLTPEVQRTIARYIVNTGDVIISIAGSIGLVAAVPQSLNGANLTENAAKLVARTKNSYLPDFLAFMLRMKAIQSQIDSHVGQVTIGKLALFRIEKLLIPLPPLSLQQNFATRIQSVESLKAIHRAALIELDTLFASLQHRAFRGEL